MLNYLDSILYDLVLKFIQTQEKCIMEQGKNYISDE